MRSHVYALLDRHRVSWESSSTWQAWPDMRRIEGPEVRSEESYLSALHEIAHVVHKPAQYRFGLKGRAARRDIMRAEAAAWQWAIRASRFPLGHRSFRMIERSLSAHARKLKEAT